jgi:NSS family neurotransmitter:Na+ symporter
MTFVGVAVGLGNVWRFPYMVSAFGGGAFLLVYFVILVAFGLPALMAELTLGRMTRRETLGTFSGIGMPGGRLIGWTLTFGVFMAVSYYTVIVGWVLRYFAISMSGDITEVVPESFFDQTLGGFRGQFVTTAIILFFATLVLSLGVKNGIERVSKVGMPLLFAGLLILVARVVTLPGAGEGLVFYLKPDLTRVDPGVVVAAMGQVFFSLSLGGTYLLTYASYMPGNANIPRTAASVVGMETLAAVLAGLVIVPAAVVFGLELNSGPALTFITAPTIFASMPSPSIFASLFFGLLLLAAFLSAVAAFEVLVATATAEFGMSRTGASVALCGMALVAAVPAMLSLDYILKSDLLWGSALQPIGSALVLLGLGWVVGLGKSLEEANRGSEKPLVGKLWFFWIRYVVPVGIVVILVLGLRDALASFGS